MITNLSLGAWCIDRLIQLLALFQAITQLDAAHSAIPLIGSPAAARDIASDNALNRQHRQLLTQHGIAIKLRLTEEFRHIIDIRRNHVVLHDILRIVKPETGHLGQHRSLLGHLVLQDHIKCRNAVRRHHHKLVANVIDLTYFSFFNR